MEQTKSWEDQPDELAGARLVLRNLILKGNRLVEIRTNDQFYWLTIGNLFSSQTLRCNSLAIAVEALNRHCNSSGIVPMDPPVGAVLVDAEK